NSTGSPIISNGIASLDDSGAVGIIAKNSFGMNHSLRFRANLYSPIATNYSDFGLHGWDDDFDVNTPYEVFAQRYARSYMDILTTNTGYIAALGTTYMDAYHKYEITRKATSNEWFIDDISQATESNPSTVDLSPMFCENIYPPASGYEKADIDWAFVRKFNDPEPTSTVGTEEPLAVTLSTFYAIYTNGTPSLCWTTQSETSNSGWNVYRSKTMEFVEGMKINSDFITGSGTTTLPTNYSFEDEYGVIENLTYYYWLESVDFSGVALNYGPIPLTIPEEENQDPPELIECYGLRQNYPNPFNPKTEISFTLKNDCIGDLLIYNIRGEKVKTIFSDFQIEKGKTYNFIWDGKDDEGKSISSGVYLYQLVSENYISTKTMILLK
ncbi:MAG: T9SS type A sorting domain-containing protein, partial [Candidatus Cloacimonetes bacterium]|nr:T9SS type A sorting domain-containing protein [Candidatus Cloacimonadota bacterium]